MVLQGVVRLPPDSYSGPPTDSELAGWGWPETCAHCDYRFSDDDTWQRLHRTQYVREDTRETT